MGLAVPAQAAENLRGIAAMLGAMAVFIVSDTLMKLCATALPVGEAIFLRGVFTTALVILLVVNGGQRWALPHILAPRVLLRALADVAGSICFVAALVNLPIADVFGILQFTPLAITAGAALFLGAQVGWRRWLATLIGLLGVLVIVRPGGNFTPFALLAVASVFCSATRDLLTPSLPLDVPALIIVGGSSALLTLVSVGFALSETWVVPSLLALTGLGAASLAMLTGQHWLVFAMRVGEIAVVAPFRYSIILWAIASGLLVWGELPDPASWAGIAIVAAAGVYTFMREQFLARAS
jgi:drug/metabolite transporter (DMT)-like permease